LVTLKKEDPAEFIAECNKLSHQGRLRNNKRAMEDRDRWIIPARRVNNEKTRENSLVICHCCNKPLSKQANSRNHIKRCVAMTGKNEILSKSETQRMPKLAQPFHETEEEAVRRELKGKNSVFMEVIWGMRKNRLALAHFAVRDKVACHIVERLIIEKYNRPNLLAKARSRLRLLFEILAYFQNINSEYSSMMAIMNYDVWHLPHKETKLPNMVMCCHHICGKRDGEWTFERYNDVMTFSSVLQGVSDVIVNAVHHFGLDYAIWKDQSDRLKIFLVSDEWKLPTVRKAAQQKSLLIKFTKTLVPSNDFKAYIQNTESIAKKAAQDMIDSWYNKDKKRCIEAHQIVITAVPTAMGAFSYRRVTETFLLEIDHFQSRQNLEDEVQKERKEVQLRTSNFIQKYFVLESRGKGDNPIMTIVKMIWLNVLALLCRSDFRAWIGLPEQNKKIFGSLRSAGKMGTANAARSQHLYANKVAAEVSDPKILRSRNFRCTLGTKSKEMNLTPLALKLMCALLGHTLEVHLKHYEVPQAIELVSLMGFACEANEAGTFGDHRTKSIEEVIELPPNTWVKKGEKNAKQM